MACPRLSTLTYRLMIPLELINDKKAKCSFHSLSALNQGNAYHSVTPVKNWKIFRRFEWMEYRFTNMTALRKITINKILSGQDVPSLFKITKKSQYCCNEVVLDAFPHVALILDND